jgi:hypothetical protein
MIKSNLDRLKPRLPVLMVLRIHPIAASATPMALAATECGAKMT